MRLEDIGFYTMTEDRAKNASHESHLSRCEIVLTSRCNFNCPYCRRVGGNDMTRDSVFRWIHFFAHERLSAIRFSGGEPTLWPYLHHACEYAASKGISRIAISTNGSASRELYQGLIMAGVNDFSISLDACCAEDGEKMAGRKGIWSNIIENIQWLSEQTYVTVGVVLTHDNEEKVRDIVEFADSLGVSDIRVIPAAQHGSRLSSIESITKKHKILEYRLNNFKRGRLVRGLGQDDSHKCGLVLDDMAVNHDKHYPCIIYMRESGQPIGNLDENIRNARLKWYLNHDTHRDMICKNNCLDICVDYNNKFSKYREGTKQ